MPVRVGNVNLGGTRMPQSPAGGGRYKVGSGDSLSKIANAFGVSVQDLRNANAGEFPALADPSRDATSLAVGMVLTIPDGSGAAPDVGGGPSSGARADSDMLAIGFNPTFGAEVAGRHVPAAWGNASIEANARRNNYDTDIIYGKQYSEVRLPNGQRIDLAPLKPGATRGEYGSVDADQADVNLRAAIDSLGLEPATADKVFEAIRDHAKADKYGRDEMFQVAEAWSEAEKGGDIPDRMLISSHHTSHWYGDDDYGDVKEGAFNALADAMPKAAEQIKHLGLFGCFSAGMKRVESMRESFPNLDSLWFYEGISPGAGNGSVFHIREWDLATLGRKSLSAALNKLEANYSGFRGEAAAAWSVDEGYLGDQFRRTVSELRDAVGDAGQDYDSYLNGDMALPYETSTGPVREYYRALQHLSMHPELPDSERGEINAKIAQSIRLVFYRKMIRPKLSEHHQSTLDAAARKLGMDTRDFGTPGGDDVRKDDLAYIAEFDQLAAGSSDSDVQLAHKLLVQGMRDLDEDVIPNTWV